MIDWLGNRVEVGDVVIYAIAAGRGQQMALGTVQKIEATENPYELYKVRVLTEKTSGHWSNGPRTKPAWVNPMNITLWKKAQG